MLDTPTTLTETETEADSTSSKKGLWVTDAEIIRRWGVSEKVGYAAIHRLENTGLGFPEKQKVFGKKRFWPAVRAFLEWRYGFKLNVSSTRGRDHE